MKPFPLKVPPPLVGLLPDFIIDMDKLHKLTLSSWPAPVAALTWHLHLPWWEAEGEPFAVSPFEVYGDPVRYIHQLNRVSKASLDYPIIVRHANGVIVDGIHRLMLAWILRHEMIDVSFVSDEELERCAA